MSILKCAALSQYPPANSCVCQQTDLKIPLLQRQRVCDSKPVAVHLEVGRLAFSSQYSHFRILLSMDSTYYAGHKSTLSAVATAAHCDNVGY